MSRSKSNAKAPQVSKALNPLYPKAPAGKSHGRRALRVFLWALFVAAVSALGALLAVWTGGISLAASQTLVAFVAKEALIGAVEGVLYAAAAEWQGQRAAARALAASVREHAGERPPVAVRRISVAELESQIKALEAQLAGERKRAGEVTA